jgi:hypothetical protein
MRIEHYFLLLGAIYLAPTQSKVLNQIFGIACFVVGVFITLKGG